MTRSADWPHVIPCANGSFDALNALNGSFSAFKYPKDPFRASTAAANGSFGAFNSLKGSLGALKYLTESFRAKPRVCAGGHGAWCVGDHGFGAPTRETPW